MTVWDSLEAFVPFWNMFLLVIVYICLGSGIIKSLSDVPLLQRGCKLNPEQALIEPAAPPAGAAASGSDASREVRHSNSDIDKARNRANNALHLVLMILVPSLGHR